MTGCVILFSIAITFYITWWFIHFVDGFFSLIYAQLGIDIFAHLALRITQLATQEVYHMISTSSSSGQQRRPPVF
ncbi:protein CONTINUOUS VASCULAR RING 1-like isoform X2 [Malus domestica]|uniref:protein CONTINUOUS VASCULAR RING 1-like isoform X2 n=1 Tax=Malus domestica TaxID=3750 RepID=UPI003976A31A